MIPEKLEKKRILFVEHNQDGTVGGSHYCLLYLIMSLDKKKYKPVVIFYEHNTIIEKFNIEGCFPTVFRKPLPKTFKSPNPFLNPPLVIARKAYNFLAVSLVSLIKFISFIFKNDIDLIHLNNSAGLGWDWLIAAKLLRKKCITHERGILRFNWLASKRANYYDKIICMSNAIQTSLKENGIEKNTVTLYDGMDPNVFRHRIKRDVLDVKREFGVSYTEPLVGMVGNIREWKGQHTVVRAMDVLKKKYPGLICLLIGDVSTQSKEQMNYLAEIKKEIIDRGLDGNVIITGYRGDVPDLINSCDVMIHSSINPEPFGMVVLEAMCLEKPIIATNIGGPKEIIENGVSGILVPPGDPNVLAEKIEFLLKHPEVRLEIGKNALKRVLEEFALEKFSREINFFYDELMYKAS